MTKIYLIEICDDCYNLKGEMCSNPECRFCRRTMKEVGEYLDVLLIRPISDGKRLKLGSTLKEYKHNVIEKNVIDYLTKICWNERQIEYFLMGIGLKKRCANEK